MQFTASPHPGQSTQEWQHCIVPQTSASWAPERFRGGLARGKERPLGSGSPVALPVWITALVTLTLLCAFFPEALLLLPPALSHLVDVPSSLRKQTWEASCTPLSS